MKLGMTFWQSVVSTSCKLWMISCNRFAACHGHLRYSVFCGCGCIHWSPLRERENQLEFDWGLHTMLLYTAYVLLLCCGPSGKNIWLLLGRFWLQTPADHRIFSLSVSTSVTSRAHWLIQWMSKNFTILVTSPPHNFHVAQRQIIIVSQRTNISGSLRNFAIPTHTGKINKLMYFFAPYYNS